LTLLRPTILLASLAMLAACHGSSPKNDQRSASGEVLQGTISDAMLPVDKLKSQGPTQAPRAEKGSTEAAADTTSAADDATSETSTVPPGDGTPAPEAASTATP
jgi:hypothetical protein